MSFDVTHSEEFKKICKLEPDEYNLAKSSNAKAGREGISKTARAVINYLQSPNQEMDEDSISVFIAKVDKINRQYKAENLGTPFATSLVALNILFNLKQALPKGQEAVIQHPFVVKLSQLSSENEIDDETTVATELYQFLKKCLNPALLAVQSGQELKAFEPIVKQCLSLAHTLHQIDTKGALARQKQQMIHSWKFKSFQCGAFYRRMISYKVGAIRGLDQADKREEIAQALTTKLPEFYEYVTLGLISTKDQTALYKGILELQKEFQQYGDGERLAPLLKTFRDNCKISETPVSQKKPVQKQQSSKGQEVEEKNVFKKWREREAQTLPVEAKKEKPEAEKANRTSSTQEKKEKVIEKIQSNISKLDLNSPRFKEKVQEIIEDLKKLKPLLDPSSDISWIEHVVLCLVDPQALSASTAEEQLIQLLGEKYKLTKRELEVYSQLKGPSIQNAQSTLIKELKKGAPHFETLNDVCKVISETFPTQMMKDRLTNFASGNSLRTVITPLFANNFIYIVNAFQVFSEKIVQQELESKWAEMLAIYDTRTQGRFSKVLKSYSYLDPRRQFNIYKEMYQKKIFDNLDFAKIGQLSEENLLSYLKDNIEVFKQYPGKCFSDNYKTAYQEKHQWLLQNITRVKRSYNQGDQDNTNLGAGVCYNNSLYRWKQIASNPKLPPKEILLGSNDQTRFNQNKHKRFYEAYQKNAISAQELMRTREEIATPYGLNPPVVTPIASSFSKQSVHEALVEAMEKWSQTGHQQVLVVLRKSYEESHAVNVRFDKDNNVYSLIDDNIGLVEFKDLEELKKELSTYFKLFYPQFTTYEFETFN